MARIGVKQTLQNFGIEGGLDENNKFPDKLLESFLGKEVLTLSYVRGIDATTKKALWGRWNILAPAGSEEKLRKQFAHSVKRGYPKDYKNPENDSMAGLSSGNGFHPEGAPAVASPSEDQPGF